jgi:integrase
MRLTNKTAQSEPPQATQKLLYDEGTPLGLRITPAGARTWFCEVWLRPQTTGERGKSVRRSIGPVHKISADAARAAAIKMAGELVNGRDALNEVRQVQRVAKQDAQTVADAVDAYIKGKRRGKDGLALKTRTAHDYQQMVEEGGLLFELAHKSIHRLTAEDIRETYKGIAARSEHSAAAAMRLLRAVLNWHGIVIEHSPFAKTTPGRDRIVLKPTVGKPRPIPPEKLHAWWTAASARAGNPSADGCRLMLLTGCRPGEIFGSAFAEGLKVGDVDLEGGRIHLQDTKNRTNHTVMLSHQAMDILRIHCKAKKPQDKVFDLVDPGKTIAAINREAGVSPDLSCHKLRHSFASIAEELVSSYALKRMLNHANGADITGGHYVGKSEAQLRAGWQAVADFIAPAVNVRFIPTAQAA